MKRLRILPMMIMLLLLLLVAYPLSYGPVMMFASLGWTPGWLVVPRDGFYEPMLQVVVRSPRPVHERFCKYMKWWHKRGDQLDPRTTNDDTQFFFESEWRRVGEDVPVETDPVYRGGGVEVQDPFGGGASPNADKR